MKVALVSDLHFDSYPGASKLHPSGMTTRLVDMLNAFKWAWTTAQKEGCKRLIVLGDIFDSRTSIELPVIDGVCRAMQEAAAHLELWVLVGNHDSYLRGPSMHSLRMLHGVARVFERPQVVDGYAMVPWHDEPQQIAEGVQSLLANEKAHTLCTHGLLAGDHAGGSKGFSMDLLCADKFRHVFLGDVHDPVQMSKNVRYVGALMQIDYRDAGKQRGFITQDTVTGRVVYFANETSPKYHLLASASAPMTGIDAGDFVRVLSGDAKSIASVRAMTANVEVLAEEVQEEELRLHIPASAEASDILEKYVRHVAPKSSKAEVAARVKAGMVYMENHG